MKLYTHCTRCNAQIAIKSTYIEMRLDLAKRDGAEDKLTHETAVSKHIVISGSFGLTFSNAKQKVQHKLLL